MKSTIVLGAVIGLLILIAVKMWSRNRPLPEPASTRTAAPATKPDGTENKEWRPATDVVLQGERFLEPQSRLGGTVPKGWVFQSAIRRGDNEVSLLFRSPDRPGATLNAYFAATKPIVGRSAAEAAASLRQGIPEKTAQRQAAGLSDYKVRPDEKLHEVHGNSAISWTADFSRDGAAWRECLTRVQGERFTILFFLLTPSTDADATLPAYDSLILNARLP